MFDKIKKQINDKKQAELNLTSEELVKKLNILRRVNGACIMAIGLMILFR